jgi:RimJ/RimL family protein N-acetyltransferase
MTGFFHQSSRLGFRVWHETDLPLARALWGDPAVTRFITVGALPEGQIRARLEQEIQIQQRHGIQYWPVFLVATGEHIGCCGLRPHGADSGTPEFGVHIASRHWRQGYAFEAATCVIDHAFRIIGANALFAGHHPSNTASRGLLARLGFVYTHDEFYEPTGLHHPSYLLTHSQWSPSPALSTDPNRQAFDQTGEAG